MDKKLNPLLDPRGFQERPILKLAPRVTLEELKKGQDPLLQQHETRLLQLRRSLRPHQGALPRDGHHAISSTTRKRSAARTRQALEEYAAMLAKEKPTAAVVALGDMGTSPATCIVTIALEKLGIPSVYITAPPGGDLVEGVAVYRAGNLCLCKIDIYQASTSEEVRHRSISSGTTSSIPSPPTGEKLSEVAHIDFKMDKVPPRKNGLLPIIDKIEVIRRQAL